jgi:hypothetical protein
MTTYREIDLSRQMKSNGEVTITVVDYDGREPFDLTFTNYDECLNEIQHYEQTAEVYF